MDSTKIIVAVVLVLLLGGGAYFYFQNQNGMNNQMPAASMAPADETSPMASPSMSASDQGMMATDSGTTSGTVKEFTVEGSAFKFVPATMTVNKGDTVRITFKNTGGFHDFVIDEFDVKTKQIGAGASETIEFVADQSGTFEYYCSVGNHRAQGMKGTLTVK